MYVCIYVWIKLFFIFINDLILFSEIQNGLSPIGTVQMNQQKSQFIVIIHLKLCKLNI